MTAKVMKKAGALVFVIFLSGVLIFAVAEKKHENKQNNLVEPSQPITFSSTQTQAPIQKEKWMLKLVNNDNPLPNDYDPNLSQIENGYYFDERAANALKEMLKEARANGTNPVICSAYRSTQRQQTLFNAQVEKQIATGLSKNEAMDAAKTIVAYPGTSEHNLGLAVDIVSREYQLLDEKQEETDENKWLRENCTRFGFIVRYPSNKTNITGVIYEPWHFRYVGKEAAEYMTKNNICLEEYHKIQQ